MQRHLPPGPNRGDNARQWVVIAGSEWLRGAGRPPLEVIHPSHV